MKARGPRVRAHLEEVAIQAERVSRLARVFHVPAKVFAVETGRVFDLIELHLARYPFDVVEVRLDDPNNTLVSTSGRMRPTRVIFARSDDQHGVWVHFDVGDVMGQQSLWQTRTIVIRADGCGGYDSPPEDIVDIEMTEGGAATWWCGLVSLCHLLDERGATREMIDLIRVDEAGRAFTTRQQARAAQRDGTDREAYMIRLRPGRKLGGVLRSIGAARREVVRANPRRHSVPEHRQRYHTKNGTIRRVVADYERGGKMGPGPAYDVRPLVDSEDTL